MVGEEQTLVVRVEDTAAPQDGVPVTLRQDGEVVWATLNRPARLNALSRNLVTEFARRRS